MQNEKFNLITLGEMCAYLRWKKGIRLADIADELGYTPQNIYNFERGKNNNARILAWYIQNGLVDSMEERGYHFAEL